MKIKIVLSNSYGSFMPNKKFQDFLLKKGYKNWWELKARTDEDVIQYVENNLHEDYLVAPLGENEWEHVSIVEVNTSIPWAIDHYDGAESIHYIKYEMVDKGLNYYKLLK